MKLKLEKWINNKTDSNFKRIFNDNIDKIASYFSLLSERLLATNTRIDNLVVNTSKDRSNEVVDACVAYDGTVHTSLKARIDYEVGIMNDSLMTYGSRLDTYESRLDNFNELLTKLYNDAIDPIDIYVSQEIGNDETGDGTEVKPFKTIQKAVDSMPIISVSSFMIIVDKGSYKEDVVVKGKVASNIEIVAYNNTSTKALTGDTGVYLRSLRGYDVNAYFALRGFTIIDTVNANSKNIEFDKTKYFAVDNCRFSENTKSNTNFIALACSASNGSVTRCLFDNQNLAFEARYTSLVAFNNSNAGNGNATVLRANRGIILSSESKTVNGTTYSVVDGGGMVNES